MRILLREVMESKHLSIRQTAYLRNVPKSTIEDILLHKHSPRLDTLEEIAKGLNVQITDLFELDYK